MSYSDRIRRRDFLAWSGAATLLPAFEGLARAQAAALSELPRPMSIGYVQGSETWRSFKGLTVATLNRGVRVGPDQPPTAATVVPATSLIVGDQQLANQIVGVHVHGLYPIPNPTNVATAFLTVFFPPPADGVKPKALPFYPFGYKSRPAPDVPPPVRFVAPLGPTGELDMLFEVAAAKDAAVTRRSVVRQPPSTVGGRFATTFTVDWFPGRPRLQRGLYLLGLAPDTWAVERRLPMVAAGGTRPVELVSLMVSIEPTRLE